jgi:hypothetical protein
MGLAPYGKPSMLAPVAELLKLHEDGGFELHLRYFRHHRVALQMDQAHSDSEGEGEDEGGKHNDGGDSSRFPMLFSAAMNNLLGPAVAAGTPPGQAQMTARRFTTNRLYCTSSITCSVKAGRHRWRWPEGAQ